MSGRTRQGPAAAAAGAILRATYAATGAVVGAASAVRTAASRGEARIDLRERHGFWEGHDADARPWIWIQAASVGEAEIAVGLVRALAARIDGTRFVVSAMTAAGRARVRREMDIESHYFPIDYAPFVSRILKSRPPLLFVAVETEIWPETLRLLHERGVPTAVANARLSDASLPRYRRILPMLAPRLAALSKVCARDDEAARRWLSLGAVESAVEVTGNIKFDLVVPAGDREIPPLFERAPGPLLLGASTHEGEESLVLDAFMAVRARHATARLLLAPRHPRRALESLTLARAHWLAAVAWSDVVGIAQASRVPREDEPPGAWPARVDVIVLDRLGLLRSAYATADACFVGGSAVPGPGGHNLLEAAVAGCPISAGTHLDNVLDQLELLENTDAIRLVQDSAALSKFWLEAIGNSEGLGRRTGAARGLIAARRGALDRTVAALLPLVGRGGARA